MSVPASPQVLLAGATGLVGSRCVTGWLAQPGWHGRLLLPSRRDPAVHDRRVVAFVSALAGSDDDRVLEAALRQTLGGTPLDLFVSCLGTTLRRAGSRQAFIAIDRDLVLRLAQMALELGARQAILVSSVGASRQTANFYLRVKGESEDALSALGFARVDILRPGLLLGPRTDRRPMEALAQRMAPAISPLLRGGLSRYRPISADAVGGAIRRLAGVAGDGRFVYENASIERLAG